LISISLRMAVRDQVVFGSFASERKLRPSTKAGMLAPPMRAKVGALPPHVVVAHVPGSDRLP
jgi:hypothetical protein